MLLDVILNLIVALILAGGIGYVRSLAHISFI